MKPIVFLGSSANLEVPLRIASLCNRTVIGIVDSDYYGNQEHIDQIPIIAGEHDFDWSRAKDQYDFFIAQSFSTFNGRNMAKRLRYINLVNQYELSCATLIHPHSEIYSRVEVGQGSLIGFCTGISHQVKIGNHCQLHSFSMFGHNIDIGENCCFNSHTMIGSHVSIGNHVVAMPGSSVLLLQNRIHIGDHAIIHPKVTVARSVDPHEIVSLAGNNTKRIYGEVIRL